MPSSDACSLEWAYLDWNTIADDGSLPVFDTILGADIVYEPEHADLLYRVVGILLAKTSEAVFHLVVVMRPTHIRDIALLQERFTADPVPDQPSLCITACEDIQGNESSPGESSQYPHRYYEIRWQNLAAL